MNPTPTPSTEASTAEKDDIAKHLCAALKGAIVSESPFFHLVLRDCFPESVAKGMWPGLPPTSSYQDLRHHDAMQADGSSARRHLILDGRSVAALPEPTKAFWAPIREALASRRVREMMWRLHEPALRRRFGEAWNQVAVTPRISLICDLAGYRIGIHRDIAKKVITTQFYLPTSEAQRHLGTVFFTREGGEYHRDRQMEFLPNSGYSFTVGDDSYHAVDTLEAKDSPRHSLMLVYYLKD